MANRPIFIPNHTHQNLVDVVDVEFHWYPGFASSQKQKSIKALHQASGDTHGIYNILEASSKSTNHLGIALSAFNLQLTISGQTLTVETAFQGSKVFENGACYQDLYLGTSLEAKKDSRLKTSGKIVGFKFIEKAWPSEPKRAFYNWLYITALHQNTELADQVMDYNAFTDIEFNPKKSLNCQAYTVALYKALRTNGQLEQALSSQENFIEITEPTFRQKNTTTKPEQLNLF